MSATDELRRLLDERGVEHEDKHTELVPGISDWDSTWWRGIAGLEFHAVGDETFGREGCVYINGTYLTPEQAIAATLGRGTCEYCNGAMPIPYQYADGFSGWIEIMIDDAVLFVVVGNDELAIPINYCPNCGKKLVER